MKAVVILGLLLAVGGHMGRVSAQGVCPDYIPPFMGSITQVGFNGEEPWDWTISLVGPTDVAPPGDASCNRSGYISQFAPDSFCVSVVADVAVSQTPTANGCTYTFSGMEGRLQNIVSVALTCNNGGMQMDPIVNVTHPSIGVFAYAFTGSINAVCPNAPPPSPPSPPAPTNMSLTQLVCSDSQCSQNCVVRHPLQGQCELVGSGESAVIACTSANAVTSELFPQSDTCSGPSATATVPTGLCMPNGDDGTFVSSFCTATQAQAKAPLLRLPKRRHH